MRRLHFRSISGIKCIIRAKGSSIEPEVKIYIGNNDITHRFEKNVDRLWLDVGGMYRSNSCAHMSLIPLSDRILYMAENLLS